MSGADPGATTVRRRHVFFIAGFDPKRARWYHALYQRQARAQAAAGGPRIEVGRERRDASAHSVAWTLRSGSRSGPGPGPGSGSGSGSGSGPGAHADARSGHGDADVRTDSDATVTTYELLAWDDIVREHWARSPWRVLRDGVHTVAWGLLDGAVQRMYALYRPPVYATFFPLVVLGLCLLVAIGLGAAAAAALAPVLPPGWPSAAGVAVAIALTAGALHGVHRIQITWLLRLVQFTRLQAYERVPGLDDRLAAFAARIREVASPDDGGDGDVDEILLVGHSVGATLALRVLAQLADLPRPPTFLSLGHCVPLLTALSPAARWREELGRVAASRVEWLDVSAPIDWAAFPAVDPVRGAGLPPAPPGWHPRLVSPRFHQLFGPATYRGLKRNRFRVHLQYLMATERPGPYDFFAITAGPQRLQDRFRDDGERAPE